LDGGATVGAEIGAYFDSMLVKVTCRGADRQTAITRMARSLSEFRIRGVATNMPFLQAVLADPDFLNGRVDTGFIDAHPQLLSALSIGDKGLKLMNYLADVTVNAPHGPAPTRLDPAVKLPAVDESGPG